MAAVQFYFPYDIMVKPGNLGTPNGSLYVYASGTLSPLPVYASSALTTQLSNPVVADGAGRLPAIYLDNALSYRIRAFDKDGALLLDRDPYIPGVAPDSSALAPYQAAAALSATNAATSATNAANSATASSNSATASANSAATAASTVAAASASTLAAAATSATNAAGSATAAAGSASTSAASATASAASQALSTASYNAIAAAIAPGTLTGATVTAASRAILSGLSTALPVYLTEAGREGMFVFSSSNLAAAVTADAQQGVYVAPASAPTGASGAWVRASTIITPTMFGAVAKGASNGVSTDCATALNALFTFFAANANYVMDVNGVYVIRSAVTLPTVNDRRIRGNLTLYADAAMDNMFTISAIRHCTWSGRLTLVGTGTTWATRTVGCGLLLSSCFSNALPDIHLDSFAYYGLNSPSSAGSADNTINHMHIANCGSGIDGTTASLTSTWSTPVNSGAVDGTQRTTINVGTMFPANYITTHNASTVLLSQLLVRINGQYYQVYEYDAGAGTIGILPWLDPADFATGTGTLTYVMGASDRWAGGNSDVNRINNAVLQSNGRGHTQQSLYGNSVGTMESVNSGIAISLAAGNGNLMWSFDLGLAYTEGNNCDVMFGGTLTYGHIHATTELDWTKVKYFPSPRATTGTSGDRYINQNLIGIRIGYKGRVLPYEKERRAAVSTTTPLLIDQPYRLTVFQVTAAQSWFPPAPDTYAQYKNDFFGYNSAGILVFGPGADGTPAGAQTFNAPAGGYTINGSASALTFPVAAFKGPAWFVIALNIDTKDYAISLVGGAPGYAITGAGVGGTVTQATSKATAVTLNKVCGQVTTHAASLAASTSVSFTLNNTQIVATDQPLVTIASGATASSYVVTVDAVAAGSCRVHIRNVSAGALAEALVLNFGIFRGTAT